MFVFFAITSIQLIAICFKILGINSNIVKKHLILVCELCFSVALATHISLASLTTCLTRPHSLRDIGPLWAGLTIIRVIRECHRTLAVPSKLRPY
jgi:hypothetical protein